jgi:hypothetical protein
MRQLLGILAGAALGASAMYFLDPVAGAERRARLRGAAGRSDAWPPKGRHRYDTLHDDAQLRDRLRQRMGRLVSFPGAIHVQVDNHVVRLSGDVLGKELDGLLSQVRDMPGVHRIINALSAHDSADGISGLQTRQARAGLVQV